MSCGSAMTILPDGHIDREGFVEATIQSWKETIPAIPECDTCFYYPTCIRLKNAPTAASASTRNAETS